MVETITIRPEPLRPAAPETKAAHQAVKKANNAASSGAYLRDQYDFQNRLKQHYMVKQGHSAGGLRIGANQPQTVARNENTSASAPSANEEEISFYDFLDIINPLQHIPGISTIYRELTGDTIKPEFKLAGGGLFGGVLGFVGSAVDAIIETETGKDIGETVLALFDDGDANQGASPQQLANVSAVQTQQSLVQNEAQTTSNQQVNVSALTLPPNLLHPVHLPMPGEDGDRKQAGNADQQQDRDVLSVFGQSGASAHRSYQKADMLNYLEDVTFSQQL